jgi:hypothetical protein
MISFVHHVHVEYHSIHTGLQGCMRGTCGEQAAAISFFSWRSRFRRAICAAARRVGRGIRRSQGITRSALLQTTQRDVSDKGLRALVSRFIHGVEASARRSAVEVQVPDTGTCASGADGGGHALKCKGSESGGDLMI